MIQVPSSGVLATSGIVSPPDISAMALFAAGFPDQLADATEITKSGRNAAAIIFIVASPLWPQGTAVGGGRGNYFRNASSFRKNASGSSMKGI